jgi:hypothetical protein
MDNIASEVSINYHNLREQYKQLTRKILVLNELKKEDLNGKYKTGHLKSDYYQDKCSSSHYFFGLYWRAKYLKKRFVGKRLIGEMKRLEIKSDKISGEIKKF